MKTRILAGIMTAAAMALCGCNEKLETPQPLGPQAGSEFKICTSVADTKTAYDGEHTTWVASDAIGAFHAVAGSTDYISDADFTTTEAGVSVNFKGTLSGALAAGSSYDWYAIYPYTSGITTPANTSAGAMIVGSAASGVQTQNGADASHIAGANYPLAGKAADVAYDATPSLSMKQLTTLMKVVVTNGTSDAITVTSVKLTAPEDIIGSYYINFADPSAPVFTSAGSVSQTATLSVSGAPSIAAGSSAAFYLATKPFTAAAGSTLSLSVTADNGEQVIEMAISGNVVFAPGKMNTLNFTYEKAAAPVDPYKLVAVGGKVNDCTEFFVFNDKYLITRNATSGNVTKYTYDASTCSFDAGVVIGTGFTSSAVKWMQGAATESANTIHYVNSGNNWKAQVMDETISEIKSPGDAAEKQMSSGCGIFYTMLNFHTKGIAFVHNSTAGIYFYALGANGVSLAGHNTQTSQPSDFNYGPRYYQRRFVFKDDIYGVGANPGALYRNAYIPESWTFYSQADRPIVGSNFAQFTHLCQLGDNLLVRKSDGSLGMFVNFDPSYTEWDGNNQ